MLRTFVETSSFTRNIEAYDKELLLQVQIVVLENIESAPIIPGTGGLRKVRVGDQLKGKGNAAGFELFSLICQGRSAPICWVCMAKERRRIFLRTRKLS